MQITNPKKRLALSAMLLLVILFYSPTIFAQDPKQAAGRWQTNYDHAVHFFEIQSYVRAAGYFHLALKYATNRAAADREHYIAISLGGLAGCCVATASNAPDQRPDASWLLDAKKLATQAEKLHTATVWPDDTVTRQSMLLNLAYCQIKLGQDLAQLGHADQALPFLQQAVNNVASNAPPATLIDNLRESLDATLLCAGADAAQIQKLRDAAGRMQVQAVAPHQPHHVYLSPADIADQERRGAAANAASDQKQRALEAAQARAAAQGAQNGLEDANP